MDKDKKKKTETDQSWKKFEDFAANLLQVKPEDLQKRKAVEDKKAK